MGFPRRALRSAYDRDAPDYERRFAALQAVKIEALLARARPAPGQRVLDAGCGTGFLVRALSSGSAAEALTAQPEILALDFSAGMLRAGHFPGALRVQADVHALPLASDSIDLAYAVTSLLGEPGEVLTALLELRRVLRPGGRLALSLLESELWGGVDDDLRACGLAPSPSFACGQDRAWICAVR